MPFTMKWMFLRCAKNNLEQSLSNGVNNKIDEWQSSNPNLGGLADPLRDSLNQTIHDGIGLIPDSSQVVLGRPSYSPDGFCNDASIYRWFNHKCERISQY